MSNEENRNNEEKIVLVDDDYNNQHNDNDGYQYIAQQDNGDNNQNVENNNQNPEIINPYNVDNQAKSAIMANVVVHLVYIIFCSFWYLLFLSFTSNPEHYGSEKTCVEMLYTARGLTKFYYTLILVNVIMLLMLCCIKDKFMTCLYFTLFIFYSIYFLIMLIVYLCNFTRIVGIHEKCGDLRTLVLVWLILYYVMIFGTCLCCICLTLCMGLGSWAMNTANLRGRNF